MPQIRCSECHGAGCVDLTDEDGDSDSWPCTRCNGTGQIESDNDNEIYQT